MKRFTFNNMFLAIASSKNYYVSFKETSKNDVIVKKLHRCQRNPKKCNVMRNNAREKFRKNKPSLDQ